MFKSEGAKGWWCAIGAYVAWGLFPLYWRLLQSVNVWEVLCHRIIWSALPLIGGLIVSDRLRVFPKLFVDKKQKYIYTVSSVLIAFNWGIFVWAISRKMVLECSLGYFISPLMQVGLGVLVLREKIRPLAKLAIAIASLSLFGFLLWQWRLPFVSLGLGLSFAIYGLLRKCGQLNSWDGLALETTILFIPAIIFLCFIWKSQGVTLLQAPWMIRLLLIGAGTVTVIPLLMYATAARSLPLSAIGLLQYIGPTLQYLIALYVFKEHAAAGMQFLFPFIWLALLIFIFDQWRAAKAQLLIKT